MATFKGFQLHVVQMVHLVHGVVSSPRFVAAAGWVVLSVHCQKMGHHWLATEHPFSCNVTNYTNTLVAAKIHHLHCRLQLPRRGACHHDDTAHVLHVDITSNESLMDHP
jgi:hypothetical protein